MKHLLIGLMLLGGGGIPVMALEQPVVQVQVEPAQVRVGEPVTLRVSVYAPTWFPQPPEFPSFELPNTVTRLPANSSGPVSQRVDGSTWSGIQRRYQIIPLIAGQFLLQDRHIEVTYADPQSRSPIVVALPIPQLSFSAEVPAAAQALDPYLAGDDFTLDRTVSGNLDELAVDDALVLSYRASIEGLPAIFLPPLWQPMELPGLISYVEEPVVTEADGVAIREERITLVFQAGGDYTLPGRRLDWWNSRSGAIEQAIVDPLQLSVSGAAVAVALDQPSSIAAWLVAVAVGLAFVLAAAWLLLPRWQSRQAQRLADRERYLASEEHSFNQLLDALAGGQQADVYQQLLAWLWRLEPGLELQQFAGIAGERELIGQLEALRAGARGVVTENFDGKALAGQLERARDHYRARSDTGNQLLPAMNP